MRGLVSTLANAGIPTTLALVNNGSTDGTGAIVDRLARILPDFQALHLAKARRVRHHDGLQRVAISRLYNTVMLARAGGSSKARRSTSAEFARRLLAWRRGVRGQGGGSHGRVAETDIELPDRMDA